MCQNKTIFEKLNGICFSTTHQGFSTCTHMYTLFYNFFRGQADLHCISKLFQIATTPVYWLYYNKQKRLVNNKAKNLKHAKLQFPHFKENHATLCKTHCITVFLVQHSRYGTFLVKFLSHHAVCFYRSPCQKYWCRC